MNPIIVSFGGFDLRWYSVLIATAIVIAYFMIMSESRRFQVKQEFMFNLMFWTLLFAIVGARIYYVVFNLNYYLDNPAEIIQIWNGGLAIHGGLIAGALTIFIYCKKYKANLGKILDIIIPALLLGQAIGRWGNFFNREAYGALTNSFFRMEILTESGEYISVHPTFLYESLWCVLGFLLLLLINILLEL